VESALSNPNVILAGLEVLKVEADKADTYLAELGMIENRLADTDKEQEKLLQWALKGFPESTIIQENQRINHERESLKQRKAEIEARIESARQAQVDADSVRQAVEMVRANLDKLSFESKRLALESLNIRVVLGKDSVAIEGAIPVSYGVVASTPSNRNGERMPSISACQLTQPGQSMPLDWGLPHLGQSGGIIRGSDRWQAEQINSPSLPQPTHHCGNRRSSAIPLSLAN
jgi:regulator of replication initiation timing